MNFASGTETDQPLKCVRIEYETVASLSLSSFALYRHKHTFFYHIIKSEPIETTENCSNSLLIEANKSKYVDNCTWKLIVFTGIYLVTDKK